MQMLYNSDSFVVVQFDIAPATGAADTAGGSTVGRGGYEIVDKFLRKEIFLEGAMAQSFRAGVDALVETGPSEDEMDAYIERFACLMQQPVVVH